MKQGEVIVTQFFLKAEAPGEEAPKQPPLTSVFPTPLI